MNIGRAKSILRAAEIVWEIAVEAAEDPGSSCPAGILNTAMGTDPHACPLLELARQSLGRFQACPAARRKRRRAASFSTPGPLP